MTSDFTLGELSDLFARFGTDLAVDGDPKEVFERMAALAVERVPGAQYAGITMGRPERSFQTVAASDDLVQKTDQIQYDLRSGPCVDAIIEDTRFNARDLRTDPRWPEFGKMAAESTGVLSMLALRLYVEGENGLISALNMYSEQESAFDESSETIALLLATHGSLAVRCAAAEQRHQNVLNGLRTGREIGIAMGIIMVDKKVTREAAFDLLRLASQHSHRKVADIATEVADTGVLPYFPTRRH